MITQQQLMKYVCRLNTNPDLPTEPLAALFANLDTATVSIILKDTVLETAINDAIDAEEIEEEAAIRELAGKLKSGHPLRDAIEGTESPGG